jgi:hypothetical protein
MKFYSMNLANLSSSELFNKFVVSRERDETDEGIVFEVFCNQCNPDAEPFLVKPSTPIEEFRHHLKSTHPELFSIWDACDQTPVEQYIGLVDSRLVTEICDRLNVSKCTAYHYIIAAGVKVLSRDIKEVKEAAEEYHYPTEP